MLHDSVIEFLRDEFRAGHLLVNPDQYCTVAFLEHLATFIARQQGRCVLCDAVVVEVEHLRRQESRP